MALYNDYKFMPYIPYRILEYLANNNENLWKILKYDTYDCLSKEDLTNILKLKDFGIIAQYEKLLEVDNIKLEIDESAVLKIVDIAYKSTTGARSLKQVMEKIMLDIMFNLETNHSVKTCLISSSTIDDHRNYKLI